MSRTPNIGVVKVGYWSYAASAMIECLNLIISNQVIIIPRYVLYDAWKFFQIVLEHETGDATFDNPLARINAQVIVSEILNDCPVLQSRTLKEANGHFRRFAEFLEELKQQPVVPLNDEDKKNSNR